MKTVDRTGLRYGRLVALKVDESVPKIKGKSFSWLCKCDCGKIISVIGNQLGHRTNSCGCLKLESSLKNLPSSTHGKSKERLFKIWYGMIDRCENPKNSRYEKYKNINVFEEWKESYHSFEKWSLLNGYQNNLSIDRIDNEGDYKPSNCRWITMDMQAGNKSNTLRLEYKGEVMSLHRAYHLEKRNISYHGSKKRYHKGERNPDKLFVK